MEELLIEGGPEGADMSTQLVKTSKEGSSAQALTLPWSSLELRAPDGNGGAVAAKIKFANLRLNLKVLGANIRITVPDIGPRYVPVDKRLFTLSVGPQERAFTLYDPDGTNMSNIVARYRVHIEAGEPIHLSLHTTKPDYIDSPQPDRAAETTDPTWQLHTWKTPEFSMAMVHER